MRNEFLVGNSNFYCRLCRASHKRFLHKIIIDMNESEKFKIVKVFCRECHKYVYSSEVEVLREHKGFPQVYYEECFRPYRK
jgi:hypothetical protein